MGASNAAALAIAGVIAIGFVIAICRAGRRVDELINNIPAPTPQPAIRDTEPGINLALHDACELIFGMPAYQPVDPGLAAGCDRLWDAVRDEQQKGEQA